MSKILIFTLCLSLLINAVLFLFAYANRSDKLTDLSYSLSFLSVAWVGFFASNRAFDKLLLALAVTIWAFRLGGFLFYRVLKVGKDSRFDEWRNDFIKFGKFWLGQAIVVWLLMIPYSIFMIQDFSKTNSLLFIGLAIFLIGWAIESIADAQKFQFSQNPKNKGKWIASGIWKYSRHPNYFGEILVWIGLYVSVLLSVSTLEKVVGIISPISIMVTLLFLSGVPLLEKSADKKWGKNPDYQKYKKSTPVLIPKLK